MSNLFNRFAAATVVFILAVAGVSAPSQAVLLDYTFSFYDIAGADLGGNTHVAGTVSGRILGLADNTSNQDPVAIFIDSHPVLDAGFGPLNVAGINIVTANIFAGNPSFTGKWAVSGGVITSSDYIATFFPLNGSTAQLILGDVFNQQNLLRHRAFVGTPQDQVTGNLDGSLGITFTPLQPLQVPEPASILLFGIGLAGLGVALCRQNASRKPRAA